MPLETIAALITAVAGLIAALVAGANWITKQVRKGWVAYRIRRNDEELRAGMLRHQEVSQTLQVLRDDYGIERLIIFEGHNCGGIPTPGRPFYVTAVHWLTEGRNRTAPERFRDLPIDAYYMNMLVRVMQDGDLRFTTESEPPCQLREIYRADGIKDSLILYLGNYGRSIFYMSAASFTGELSDRQLTEARLQANRIGKLIEAGI